VSTTITARSVGTHYDDLDLYYRELWGEHVHHGYWHTGRESADDAVRALIDRVAEKGRLRGQRVCDVGCGYGGTARVLAADYTARVTGLTVSARQLDFARRATPEADNPTYLLQNWLENELPDESFDRVLAIESLSHMPDKPAFFRQACRVLRPGGRLVVCAWLTGDRATDWQRRHLLEPLCREGRLPGMPTETECRQLIRDSGLGTWSLCIRRLLGYVVRRPAVLGFLLDPKQPNRVFALTVFRIWLAYRNHSMRYGLFVARKPEPSA